MYFKPKKKKSLLQVRDNFAKLVAISSKGDLKFEFKYFISQRDAIIHNALRVNVSVVTKVVTPPPILSISSGELKSQEIIDNILTQMPHAKHASEKQNAYVVKSKVSDVTAKINNQSIGQLKTKVSSHLIAGVGKTKLKTVSVKTLKEKNETHPILNYSLVQAQSSSIDPQSIIQKMILQDGIDPSSVTEMNHRSTTPYDVTSGFVNKTRKQEISTSNSTKYADFLLNPTTKQRTTDQVLGSSQVETLVKEYDETVEVTTEMTLPSTYASVEGANKSGVLVKFELMDSVTDNAIDTIIHTLDIERHIQMFNIPKTPPTIKLAKADLPSKANLEIKQVDPVATGIKIYRKMVSSVIADSDDYTLVSSHTLSASSKSLLISVDVPLNATAIYRVIPVGKSGALSFEYTNVIIKPRRYFPIKHISLSTKSVNDGMKIEVRNIPKGVVSIQLLRADKTVFENQLSMISSMLLVERHDYISFTDQNVKNEHIYEYACNLVYSSGTVEVAGGGIFEYVKNNEGRVDSKITGLKVDTASSVINVTFNIQTIVPESSLDSVKTMLTHQNLISYFNADILKERDKLQQLIAHRITRVNLTTGQHEDFGVITGQVFSDVDVRKNNSILPLKKGNKYRYDVAVLLRTPETMFEEFVKTSTDSLTKKDYRFKPSKFLHPIALSKGNIASPEALTAHYAKTAMTHGQIGTVTSVEVSLIDQSVRVVNPVASALNEQLNIITWKLQGSLSDVDHFVIMKIVMGTKTIVGKAHSEFKNNNCQFIHKLTSRDQGSITYSIVPVLNSYKLGEITPTNAVVI